MMHSDNLSFMIRSEWDKHDPQIACETLAVNPQNIEVPTVLMSPKNGYTSFRLVVCGSGEFQLKYSLDKDLQVDLFKVWYHHCVNDDQEKKEYHSDALIPVSTKEFFQLPNPDNQVPDQKVQEFWVDIYVPKKIRADHYLGEFQLILKDSTRLLPFVINVQDITIPDEPVITMDNNSYGCRWLPLQYPELYSKVKNRQHKEFWHTTIDLLHNYYRLAREHRMIFHNLGAGHSGTFDPIYGPSKKEEGRKLTLSDWELFDKHYGPLLDGSVFKTPAPGMKTMKYPADPVWGVYTPINPAWPADYLWWGEEGYEEELVRGLKSFDAHFIQKGWTETRIEFFFNHKKRYRWFEWDGDEQKFYKDFLYHEEMIKMWEKATLNSKVNWVYRADASWHVKRQIEELGGHRNFWVAGNFIKWYPEKLKQAKDRGEVIWTYGSYPSIRESASTVLENLYSTWALGLNGFAPWDTTKPGADPWFNSNGCSIGAFYSGERFNISGPIPSIRMKVLRNGIQDIDLLDILSTEQGRKEDLINDFSNTIPVKLWETPPQAVLELPPDDWDNHNLKRDHEPHAMKSANLNSQWWKQIRDLVLPQGIEKEVAGD